MECTQIEQFLDMYISYDVSLLFNPLQMHNNINTHVHVKTTMFFIIFIIHYLLCMKQIL